MIRKLFFAIVLLCCTIASFAEVADADDPKADPSAMVIAGNARFTVLTSRLVRMEWSEDGVFEDNATLTFINRKLPVPDFKVSKSKSKVVIKTSDMILTYKQEGKFTSENLKVEFLLGGKKVLWTPGMEDDQNLMGTTRTLDGCDGDKLGKEPMEQGIVSRSGWSVVDDSRTHLLVIGRSGFLSALMVSVRIFISSLMVTITRMLLQIILRWPAALLCLRNILSDIGGAVIGSTPTMNSVIL